MKIGILYICTGKYTVFRKDFYLSAEKYFLTNHDIHYFVFTDSSDIYDYNQNPRIHIIPHKHLWWPDATLMRFHTFLWEEEALSKMDYLFFCNANLEIKQIIWEEILPSDEEEIVATQHPWFYNKKDKDFTYERNINSTAYIAFGEWKHYLAWWFNGWSSANFLSMCKTLSKNIDSDKKNNIIALRHDESHINNYLLNKTYKLLDAWYLYPESWGVPFEKKIIVRDKSKLIPVDEVKWNKFYTKYLNKILYFIKNIIW